MFDWDYREIENIIWGEADDHVVPYPEDNEKKPLQFTDPDNNELTGEASISKPSQQKTSASKNNLHGGKSENDEAKKSDLEKGAEISEDQHEDGEIGDIVGNSWANIGSFDDLDQIFNDNDLVDHASLESTDELWLSSRDVISGTTKSSSLALESRSWRLEGLDNSSGDFKFNTDYLHDEKQTFGSGYGKSDSPLFSQNLSLDQAKVRMCPRLKVASTESVNKDNLCKGQLKHEFGATKISDCRLLEDVYGSWPLPSQHVQHFDTQFLPAAAKSYVSPVTSLQNIPHQHLSNEQFSNPYAPAFGYGNFQDQYITVPALSNAKADPSEMGSIEKSKDTSAKPMKMTPQQKIEKLRRRQQMRAALAIQKQQQQLTHPVSGADYTIAQKSSLEDQIQLERTDVEPEDDLKTPRYDPNSPLKQDDSASISGEVDDHDVEETVLYQLQDMAAKLDMKTRLCIRDSLFRLAQSAMQRHHASDSGSGKRRRIYELNNVKEDMSNHNRFAKMPSAETVTNHIDRAVAHLLFHRPFKPSGKSIVTPESLTPTKIPPELEAGASTKWPMSSLAKNSENEQSFAPRGSNAPPTFTEPHQEHSEERPRAADMTVDQKMKQKMAVESVN